MISWYIDSSCVTPPPNTESRVCHPRTSHHDAPSWWLSPPRCSIVVAEVVSWSAHGHESLTPGPEETLGVADPVREDIYLGVRVVQVERRAGARLHTQGTVQRPGAVVPGAYRDAQLVEHLA